MVGVPITLFMKLQNMGKLNIKKRNMDEHKKNAIEILETNLVAWILLFFAPPLGANASSECNFLFLSFFANGMSFNFYTQSFAICRDLCNDWLLSSCCLIDSCKSCLSLSKAIDFLSSSFFYISRYSMVLYIATMVLLAEQAGCSNCALRNSHACKVALWKWFSWLQ